MPALRFKGTHATTEAAVTGRGRIWYPGELGYATEARARLLLASRLGWDSADAAIVPRSVRIANLIGTVAAPLSSLTGVTSGQLTLTTPIKIPANTLEVGSVVRVRALFNRAGANATALIACRLGTANAVGDSLIANITVGATDGLCLRMDAEARIQTATQALNPGGCILNSTSTSGVAEVTTNIDITADMFVTFHIASANAADTFRALAVTVDLEL